MGLDQVRAFVGYSYLEKDEDVVASFLGFLDSQARDNPLLSWEHAKLPEAQGISEKVLSYFADKNCFIGICTRRERAVLEDDTAPIAEVLGRLIVPKGRLRWKTSDWVVQEIGLAIGRKMSLVLLVEDGVALPGGLQADLEWIPFQRDAPEKAFTKLAHMLKSLTPPATAISGLGASVGSTSENKGTDEKGVIDLTKPEPTWKAFDYELAYLIILADGFEGYSERALEIERLFLSSPLAEDESVRIDWQAFTERTRIEFARGGNIDTLRKLAEQHPTHPAPVENLARVLAHYNDKPSAAELYSKAASLENDRVNAVRLLGRSAEQYVELGKPELARDKLREMQRLADEDPAIESNVLLEMRDVAEALALPDFYAGALERYLVLHPESSNQRFKLAYANSSSEQLELAVYHYEAIPENARDAVTWNNLGVGAKGEDLNILAVKSFKEGAKKDFALSKANLAARYDEAGFIDEAQALGKEALAAKEVPEYANNVMLQIASHPEEEREKLKKLRDRARTKSQFYSAFGAAMIRPSLHTEGTWSDALMELTFKFDDSSARAEGVEFTSAVANALLQIGEGEQRVRRKVRLAAETIGCAFVGTLAPIRDSKEPPRTFLGDAISSISVVGYFDHATGSLAIMQEPKQTSPTFRLLHSQRSLGAIARDPSARS